MSKTLSRRTFLRLSSALAAAGILAWKPDTEIVDAAPAQEGGEHTSVSPALDEVIATGHREQPFSPYCVDTDFYQDPNIIRHHQSMTRDLAELSRMSGFSYYEATEMIRQNPGKLQEILEYYRRMA